VLKNNKKVLMLYVKKVSLLSKFISVDSFLRFLRELEKEKGLKFGAREHVEKSITICEAVLND
jgi:hypothetical protein